MRQGAQKSALTKLKCPQEGADDTGPQYCRVALRSATCIPSIVFVHGAFVCLCDLRRCLLGAFTLVLCM